MSTTQLQSARYVSLVTYRKSGKEVATPVWAAFEDDTFYIFSAGEAGKVKRLRNSDKARIAKCDGRGKLLGEWYEAKAYLIKDLTLTDTALAALRRKYGVQMWLADFFARLLGKFNKRAYIAVRLA
ncbi:MAG: PPOX class F420-dependent oxidoreductase [Pseudomonadota bacterium]|nr:PPOX class F420-dependent oxidoreductase [Pseudomonadota bacterium]